MNSGREETIYRRMDSLICGYLQRRNYVKTLDTLIAESPSLSALASQGVPGKVFFNINDVLYEKTLEEIIENFTFQWRTDISEGLVNLIRRLGSLSREFDDYAVVGPGRYEKNVQQQLYGTRDALMAQNPTILHKNSTPMRQVVQTQKVVQTMQPSPLTNQTMAYRPSHMPQASQQGNPLATERSLNESGDANMEPVLKEVISKTLHLAQQYQNRDHQDNSGPFDTEMNEAIELYHQAIPFLEGKEFDLNDLNSLPDNDTQTLDQEFGSQNNLNIPMHIDEPSTSQIVEQPQAQPVPSAAATHFNPPVIKPSSEFVTPKLTKTTNVKTNHWSKSTPSRTSNPPRKPAFDAEKEVLAVPAIQIFASNVAPVPETSTNVVPAFNKEISAKAPLKGNDVQKQDEKIFSDDEIDFNIKSFDEPNNEPESVYSSSSVGYHFKEIIVKEKTDALRSSPIKDESSIVCNRSTTSTRRRSDGKTDHGHRKNELFSAHGNKKSALDPPTDSDDAAEEDRELLEASQKYEREMREDLDRLQKTSIDKNTLPNIEELFGKGKSTRDKSHEKVRHSRDLDRRESVKSTRRESGHDNSSRNRFEKKTTDYAARKNDDRYDEKRDTPESAKSKGEDRLIKDRRMGKSEERGREHASSARDVKRKVLREDGMVLQKLAKEHRGNEKNRDERSRQNVEEKKHEEERRRKDESFRREDVSKKSEEPYRRIPKLSKEEQQKKHEREKNAEKMKHKALSQDQSVLDRTLKLMDKEGTVARRNSIDEPHKPSSVNSALQVKNPNPKPNDKITKESSDSGGGGTTTCEEFDATRKDSRPLVTVNGLPSEHESLLHKSAKSIFKIGSLFANINDGSRKYKETIAKATQLISTSETTENQPSHESTLEDAQKLSQVGPSDPRINIFQSGDSPDDNERPMDPRLKLMNIKRAHDQETEDQRRKSDEVQAVFNTSSTLVQPQKKIKLDLSLLATALHK